MSPEQFHTVTESPGMTQSARHRLLAVAGGLLQSGCGFPDDHEVREAFVRDHPGFEVLSVGVGEGDGSAAYYQIRYRRPGEPTVRAEEWLYLDDGTGRKVLTARLARPQDEQ
jgi:hypothetical protein